MENTLVAYRERAENAGMRCAARVAEARSMQGAGTLSEQSQCPGHQAASEQHLAQWGFFHPRRHLTVFGGFFHSRE